VIVGAVVMARVGVARGRKTALPFGPFLALGGVVGLLAGPHLVHVYLHSVV
jgi:leader peptidase (prepilin peptidase)/N-methyltransferase